MKALTATVRRYGRTEITREESLKVVYGVVLGLTACHACGELLTSEGCSCGAPLQRRCTSHGCSGIAYPTKTNTRTGPYDWEDPWFRWLTCERCSVAVPDRSVEDIVPRALVSPALADYSAGEPQRSKAEKATRRWLIGGHKLYPVMAIHGPRGAGKSTLIAHELDAAVSEGHVGGVVWLDWLDLLDASKSRWSDDSDGAEVLNRAIRTPWLIVDGIGDTIDPRSPAARDAIERLFHKRAQDQRPTLLGVDTLEAFGSGFGLRVRERIGSGWYAVEVGSRG